MRFRLRVDPQDASAEFRVVGGTAAALADLSAAALWHDPWPAVAAGGWGYAAAEPHPGSERDWSEAVVTVEAYAALAAAAARGERAVAGRLAVDALRIAAWRPRVSREADGRTLPHEVDWLRTAVHLEKGCYRGQETVAKVHNLGHPPRRLIALQLDGSDAQLPGPGATVHADGDVVGVVTSAARHYEEGPIALALSSARRRRTHPSRSRLADGSSPPRRSHRPAGRRSDGLHPADAAAVPPAVGVRPATGAGPRVPHRVAARLRSGTRVGPRLQESTPAIVQIVVAATAAYVFASYVLGHHAPLLAATVTVSSLGLVRDARPRRVFETVVGMILGILIAEVIVLAAGIGWWQLAVTLASPSPSRVSSHRRRASRSPRRSSRSSSS